MQELEEGARAFSTFRVLNSVSEHAERDQLFRNMAQLFSYVSDRCDDEQVAQYDEVLCQLADLVEVEARAHVATVLAGLERAPGTVIMRLANDVIEVARPLLEFSSVLSDDDLIEIVTNKSDAHRAAIASRADVPERVGEAIIEHGDTSSVLRLVHNPRAELGSEAIEKLAIRASDDDVLAADLRGRAGIDWRNLRSAIDSVAGRVLGSLGKVHPDLDPEVAGRVNELVYNRLHNKAGFSASSWKLAYNQVKALSDRRGLDRQALARFARFSYGHHAGAALTVMLQIAPDVFVKWLASQDYVAIIVALRALGLDPALFSAVVAVLPWHDIPSASDTQSLRARFEATSAEEASEIFSLWRAHSFRRRPVRESVGAA